MDTLSILIVEIREEWRNAQAANAASLPLFDLVLDKVELRLRRSIGGQRHYINRGSTKREVIHAIASMPLDLDAAIVAERLGIHPSYVRRMRKLLQDDPPEVAP